MGVRHCQMRTHWLLLHTFLPLLRNLWRSFCFCTPLFYPFISPHVAFYFHQNPGFVASAIEVYSEGIKIFFYYIPHLFVSVSFFAVAAKDCTCLLSTYNQLRKLWENKDKQNSQQPHPTLRGQAIQHGHRKHVCSKASSISSGL